MASQRFGGRTLSNAAAAPYMPRPKNAEWPNETIPVYPMRMSDDIASRPQIRISVTKRRQNSGSTSGATASVASTMAKPIQYPRAAGLAAVISLRRGHEQAGRPEQERQHEDDERDDHRLRRAHEQRCVCLQQAHEDRGEDRAAEISHAAHHDDHEGAQGEVQSDRLGDADHRGEE